MGGFGFGQAISVGGLAFFAVGDSSPGDLAIFDPAFDEVYCTSLPNSTGRIATLGVSGSMTLDDNDFTLTSSNLPPNAFGLFYFGANQQMTAFGDGMRCVGGQVFRLPIISADANGNMIFGVDFNAGTATGIAPASTWNFQCWYRDPTGPLMSGFNLSDAIEVMFL